MSRSGSVQERIQQLRDEIDRHNQHYYVLDSPPAPDAERYNLMRELKELEQVLRAWM